MPYDFSVWTPSWTDWLARKHYSSHYALLIVTALYSILFLIIFEKNVYMEMENEMLP